MSRVVTISCDFCGRKVSKRENPVTSCEDSFFRYVRAEALASASPHIDIYLCRGCNDRITGEGS